MALLLREEVACWGGRMTFYDWFIMLVAIPGMAIGFTGLIGLWCYIVYVVFIDR